MKHIPIKEAIAKVYSNSTRDFARVVNVSFHAQSGSELLLFRRCAWRKVDRGRFTYKNSDRTKQIVARGCYFSLDVETFNETYHVASQEEVDAYCDDIRNIE